MKHTPWLCARAIWMLSQIVTPHFKVAEFGMGGSTIWFAKKGITNLWSIENNSAWYWEVSGELNRLGIGQGFHLGLSDQDDLGDIVKQESWAFDLHSDYDLIFVDNSSKNYAPTDLRERCIRGSIHALKPGGWFVVDNINYPHVVDVLEVFDNWPRWEIHDGVWHTGFYHNVASQEAWHTDG